MLLHSSGHLSEMMSEWMTYGVDRMLGPLRTDVGRSASAGWSRGGSVTPRGEAEGGLPFLHGCKLGLCVRRNGGSVN
jgi:hypothetical protein